MIVDAAIVTANCRKNSPVIPDRKAAGRKTAQRVRAIAIIAPPTATAGVWQQVGSGFDFAAPGQADIVLNGAVNVRARNLGSGTTPDDPNVVEPDSFPTAKVVGGTDFAGPTYDANPNSATFQPIPQPDGDPIDHVGHGSHVAGTLAGYGVNSDGSTFTGAVRTTWSRGVLVDGIPRGTLLSRGDT